MTIWNPPISEVGAFVQARNHRKAFSAFIQGEGLLKAADLQVSGDPSLLKLNISPGAAMLQLPDGTFDVVNSDAVEVRTLATNPSGSPRLDLIYAGIQSKEFADAANAADLIYKPNPTPGSLVLPSMDTMAGTYPIASISVPPGATKGTDCTITMLSGTTAPGRDGGYSYGDIAVLPWREVVTIKFGSIGQAVTSHTAPFTPSVLIPVLAGPINAGPFLVMHAISTITASQFSSQWVMSDNSFPVVNSTVTARLISFP